MAEPKTNPTQDNQALLQAVFDSTRDGILVARVATRSFVMANSRMADMLGYSRRELLTLGITDIHPPDELSRVIEVFKRQARGEIHLAPDIPVLRRDGTVFYSDISTGQISMAEGLCLIGVFRDVTAHREMQRTLVRAKEEWERTFDAVPDLICTLDANHTIRRVNRAMAERLGMTPSQIAGKHCFECVHAMDHPPEFCPHEMLLKDGRAHSTEYYNERLEAWFSVTASPLYDADGTLFGSVHLARDITTRKQMEALRQQDEVILKESEARHRTVLDAMDDAIFFHDKDGRFLEVNRMAYERLGLPREELLARRPQDIDSPSMAAEVPERIQKILDQGELVFESEHLASDGSVIPVEISARTTVYQGQEVILAVARDLRPRMTREMERRRLEKAIEQSAETVVITDSQGTIQYVNPAFETITGYSRAEALGQNPRIVKSDRHDAAFYKELWQTISAGSTWRGRMVNRRKDGALFTEEVVISPVVNSAGEIEHYVAVTKDVTEKEALEERLRQAQKMEAVGQLAGGVAHDFNNMLSPILGYAELLMMDLHPSDERHHQVSQIRHAAERSRALVRQLLAFSRKQVLQIKNVDLSRIVANIETLLRRTLREDITLRIIDGKTDCPVLADAAQVEQVLMNLAVNAADAMPKGGLFSIEIAAVELDESYCRQHPGALPGQYSALVVADTGCGMDEETRQHVFEPFFSTKGERGTGLGLATVYGIVQQHGGSIGLESAPGRGTTFTIYLPAAGEAEAERGALSTVPKDAFTATGKTVVVVEDDAAVRELAVSILRRMGYAVLSADSGRACLRQLDKYKGPFDLLLTDVIMPDMDGKTLSARVTERFPDIKVLFMSGYAEEIIDQHGVLESGIAFIQKPFTIQDLSWKVGDLLSEAEEYKEDNK